MKTFKELFENETIKYDKTWHKGINTDFKQKWVQEILTDPETIKLAKQHNMDVTDRDDAKRLITDILTRIKGKTRKGVHEYTLVFPVGNKTFKFKEIAD